MELFTFFNISSEISSAIPVPAFATKEKKYDDNKHEEGINVFLLKYEKLVQEYI